MSLSAVDAEHEAASAPQSGPRAAHPTALALFASLENDLNQGRSAVGAGSGNALGPSNAPGRRRRSSHIQKVSSTLGWRNRYSQSDLYPVTLEASSSPGGGRDGEEAAPRTFCVRQKQRGEVENTYGTGATVWPASIVLLKYLEGLDRSDPGFWRGTTVADLGAGTGVTSVAMALLGASLVVCTDGCERVVDLARENVQSIAAELKGCSGGKKHERRYRKEDVEDGREANAWIDGCEVRTRRYLWGDGSMASELRVDGDGSNSPYYDVILVSDCVLPKLYPIGPLVDGIDELTGPESVSYLSYEQRYYPEYDPAVKFRELAEEKGLAVRVVPISEHDHLYSVDDIEIWEVRRRSR